MDNSCGAYKEQKKKKKKKKKEKKKKREGMQDDKNDRSTYGAGLTKFNLGKENKYKKKNE